MKSKNDGDSRLKVTAKRDPLMQQERIDERIRSIPKLDPRRAQERSDARMVREDHTKMSNCSTIPMIRELPEYELHPSPEWEDVVLRSRFEDSYRGEHDPLGK
jgi:hypothetical protein